MKNKLVSAPTGRSLVSPDTEGGMVLLNPRGVIKVEPMKLALRISSLEGKTVLLHWNFKHNGDKFLDRVAELLAQKVKDVKIIKSWEVAPETATISGSVKKSEELVEKLATFKPDIFIGSQGD